MSGCSTSAFALFSVLACQLSGQAATGDKPAVAVAASTGQIQGKIDAAGKPVGAVTVSAFRMRPSPVVTAKTTTAADGSFALTGLATGTYNICVVDKSGTYVDPCEWAAMRTTADVVDGKITTAVSISLRAASVVTVRVNDLSSTLVAKNSEAFPPHILVSVHDGASFGHLAIETKRDLTGIEYRVVAPSGVSLFLNVQSKSVTLETTDHKPLAAQGLGQPFRLDSSKSLQPMSFTFNATGRNP